MNIVLVIVELVRALLLLAILAGAVKAVGAFRRAGQERRRSFSEDESRQPSI